MKRRNELGIAKVKADIVDGGLGLLQLPGAEEVRQKMVVNGSTSIDKPSSSAGEAPGSHPGHGLSVRAVYLP